MTDLSFNIGMNFSRYYQMVAEKVRVLVEPLSDDQIWARTFPYGNSIGHLLQHITGNLNYFIGAQIANTGYVRDRDLEFTAQDRKSKEELLRAFDNVIVMVQDTLTKQSATDWGAPYTAMREEDAGNRFSIFLRCAAHIDHHIGQMMYLRKEIERQSAQAQRA